MHFVLFTVTESTYKHVANVDEEPVVMEILDTAGQVEQNIQ